MCFSIPGQILSIDGEDAEFRSACVDFCGVRRTVNLLYTPEAAAGDFLLVHAGFATRRMDDEEARRAFQSLMEIGALTKEEVEQVGANVLEARPVPR